MVTDEEVNDLKNSWESHYAQNNNMGIYDAYGTFDFLSPRYLRFSAELLSLIKDDNRRNVIESILRDGGYESFNLNTCTSEASRDNTDLMMSRRAIFALNMAAFPKTAYYIMNNNIDLFHGTKACALERILKYGLCSMQTVMNEQKELVSGEMWSVGQRPIPKRDKNGKLIKDEKGKVLYEKDENGNTIYEKAYRDFVSFAIDISLAIRYASSYKLAEIKKGQDGEPRRFIDRFKKLIGLKEKAKGNVGDKTFVDDGVVLFASSKNLKKHGSKFRLVMSDMQEVGIDNLVPLEYISAVGVPKEFYSYYKKHLAGSGLDVLPMITEKDLPYSISDKLDLYHKDEFRYELYEQLVKDANAETISLESIKSAIDIQKARDNYKGGYEDYE